MKSQQSLRRCADKLMMKSPVLQGQAPGHLNFPNRCNIRNHSHAFSCRTRSIKRRPCKAATAVATGVLTPPQSIPDGPTVAEGQPRGLSQYLRDSVAILEAPNPASPDGKTKVYVLGVSHVSKRDCELVSSNSSCGHNGVLA